jgi:catechol 2,3-dioxygenase-like lactoylglutathione lyase family enzyme
MKFHHTCILTGNRELAAACERFYVDNFGMGVAFADVTDTADYSFYADNVNATICPFEIIGQSFDEREEGFLARCGPGLDHLCFLLEDIDVVVESMSSNGVKFHVPPYRYENYLIAWCRDPSGVEVELLQADIEFPEPRYEGTAPKALYHHIAILAGSRELALATEDFYRKHIGLKEAFPGHSAATLGSIYLGDAYGAPLAWIEIIATARHDNERVFLEKKGSGIEHHCFAVEDAEDYFRFLEDKGVALDSEISELGRMKTFYLRDPAGVCIQVLQMSEEFLPRR